MSSAKGPYRAFAIPSLTSLHPHLHLADKPIAPFTPTPRRSLWVQNTSSPADGRNLLRRFPCHQPFPSAYILLGLHRQILQPRPLLHTPIAPTAADAVFKHPSAVLDVAFGTGPSEGKAYSGCLDHGIRELDLSTGAAGQPAARRTFAAHADAVRCVHWSKDHNFLLTGSWDRSLMIHDPRSGSPPPVHLPNLPSKVLALDASLDKVVVAMGARKVWIWDLRMLGDALRKDGEAPSAAAEREQPSPWQERDSSLKFMTRAVRCMPNNEGYASTSIEGRVAVEFFDPSASSQSKKYAFKCHRQTVDDTDTVYPVNALAFHPILGTFATGGGDAIVSIWDPSAKKRLRQFPRYPASVSSLGFSADGAKVAVACSVLEEEGTAGLVGRTGEEKPRHAIVIREVGDDCKPKPK